MRWLGGLAVGGLLGLLIAWVQQVVYQQDLQLCGCWLFAILIVLTLVLAVGLADRYVARPRPPDQDEPPRCSNRPPE